MSTGCIYRLLLLAKNWRYKENSQVRHTRENATAVRRRGQRWTFTYLPKDGYRLETAPAKDLHDSIDLRGEEDCTSHEGEIVLEIGIKCHL